MISDINVTPLVDVMLVLLIIFMVVTEVIHETEKPESIDMNLPSAQSGQASGATEPLTVGVSSDGKFTINGEPTEKDDVLRRVQEAIRDKGKDFEVMVAADAEAPHKRFVTLLDMLRTAGVVRISIETVQPAGEAPAPP